MNALYQSMYKLGERVRCLGIPARVVAITFTEAGNTRYEIKFDTGGANGVVASDAITPIKSAA